MSQIASGKRSLVASGKRKSGSKKPKNKPNRWNTYGKAGNQLVRDVKFLMSVINVEDKYIDISGSGAAANTWNFVILNTMVQGTTPSTRIGQSIKWQGVEFRFSAVLNPLNTSPQLFRVILFVDHQPNAANATITDVYPTGVLAPRNVGYLQRFTVLKDLVFALSPSNNGASVFDYIATHSYHTMFNLTNGGTIADITKNAYYYAYITDAAANGATLSYYSRFVFVDN